MKKFILATAAIVLGLTVGSAILGNNKASAAQECKVTTVGTKNGSNGPDRKFVVKDGKATIKFNVTGSDGCVHPTLMLKSWYSPSADGSPHNAQRLFKKVEKKVGRGNNQSMTVALPATGCYYQVDLERAVASGKPEMLGFTLGGEKNCVPKDKEHKYTCDLLSVTADANRKVTVTGLRTSVTNAEYKYAVINWGDGQTARVSGNPTGQTHTFAKDGTFTIQATAYFTFIGDFGNERLVSATGPGCTQQVTFTTEKPPVVKITVCELATKKLITIDKTAYDAAKHTTDLTKCQTTTTPTTPTAPSTPEALPSTGAGGMAMIFATVTAISSAAYKFVLVRRGF